MSELLDAISSRGHLIGILVTIASTAVAESLSKSGLDWLFFDLEHSTMTLADVQPMIQATAPSCLSFIRIEEPLPVYVKRAIDTGCSGIVVPQVNSVDIAKAVVRAGKFPPQGGRSVGLGRSLGYGATLADGVSKENARTSIVVQIEHIDAVDHVFEIAALEGIDALFVGPYDLSGSLGMPGNVAAAEVQAAIDKVLKVAIAQGKPAGIFVGSAEAAKREIKRGFSFVAVGGDISRLVASTSEMCAGLRIS